MRTKLLIVEDSFVVAELLQSFFVQWECCLVDSAADALGRIHVQDFNAVLTDIGLTEGPEAGLELIQAIRERGLTMPICAMSASVHSHIAERCLKRGANDFVTKPCQLEDLRTRIDRLMNAHTGASSRTNE